jgi:predicted extracellular nuclease
MRRITILLAALVVAACGGDSNNNTNNNNLAPDGGPSTGDFDVQDVQSDSMAVGTAVTLNGVVVVAIDGYGGRRGAVYVMEPGGGPFSGVVINTSTAPSGVAVGDLVNVTGGIKDEFALNADESGQTVTQVSAPQGAGIAITKVGDGTVPVPEVLDPWRLVDPTEAEKWEGVLIEFKNVKVESRPFNVTQSDDTLREMVITGPFRISSSLTELSESIDYDDCFASIVGIGDYFFNYKVLPRDSGDLVGGGTNCLPEEDPAITEGVCSDNLDNDYDGFTDCEQFHCYGECAEESTVIAVQSDDPSVEIDDVVRLAGVVITAINRDRDGFWVQDEGSTEDHNGLEVRLFGGVPVLDGSYEVGSKVDVVGVKSDYFGATQLGNASIAFVSAASAVSRTNVDPGQVSPLASGAVYEGQLLEFSDLPITAHDTGFGTFTVGAGFPMTVDDTLHTYDLPDSATQNCVTHLAGVVILNTFDDRYYVAPRDASDITFAATCE